MIPRGRVTIGGAGLAAIAVVALLFAAGCGQGAVVSASDGDATSGKTLFVSSCGGCHALKDANTNGTVGPDLDNAFAGSRLEEYSQSAIQNLVLDQIKLGSGPIATYTDPEHGVKGLTPQTQMQPNILHGQDALDVAAYVAAVAGTSGYSTAVCGPALGTDGLTIFQGCGCAGCHTLKAANATGTTGPDLDALAPSESTVAHQVEVGGGPMPAFKGKLTSAQIAAVAKYVSSVAGK